MFLDPRLRMSATFLMADLGGRRTEIGTVFFVSKSLDDSDETEQGGVLKIPESYSVYAVTARHIITNFGDNDLYFRFNTADGSYEDLPTCANDWTGHPTTDVSVCEIPTIETVVNKSKLKMGVNPFSMLATDEYMAQVPVAEGYEVFILGLFAGYPGKKQPQPIIRFGNISLMPRETVDVFLSNEDKGNYKRTEIEAYLIEVRSMGGLSGSPVLFYHPPLGQGVLGGASGWGEAMMTRFRVPTILGLVHGQYDDEESMIQRVVNAGIAIVVPASKIRETLMQERLVEARKRDLEDWEKTKHGKPQPNL